jgi:ribonuclease P protein component
MDLERGPRHAQAEQFSSDVVARAESVSQLVFRRNRSVLSKTGRFGQADRILCSRDFKRVVKFGKRRTSESFVVAIAPKIEAIVAKPDGKRRKLGVTVSKQVGNSVIRNHVKRCIREWFRHAREALPDETDIVVIARRPAKDLSGLDVVVVLNRMILGAGT